MFLDASHIMVYPFEALQDEHNKMNQNPNKSFYLTSALFYG